MIKGKILLLLFAFPQCVLCQLNMQLQANYSYAPQRLANIGGYVDPAGREYALVGTDHGLSIVEVSNPANPDEVFFAPAAVSTWREVKTWLHYAYVTSEASDGLMIVDLGYLPDSIRVTHWYGDSAIAGQMTRAHALHIDNGYCYLFGSSINWTADILDLHSDPWSPRYLGHIPGSYVHDGFVRNDTLWAAHIYDGFVQVWNCSDKANPVLLATQITPSAFPHNTWLSDDSKILFTTDETRDSYVTAYDVSDLSNIRELSRFQTAPGSLATVHNTHFINDYTVTSWYGQGVVIADVSRPENPIEVGKYLTTPDAATTSPNCWGVYPYLPSGIILASDIVNGLFVLSPQYVRGCYLEGNVQDASNGALLTAADVRLVSTGIACRTNISGEYKTGTAVAGVYAVTISKAGYQKKTVPGIVLNNGILTLLNVSLQPAQPFSFRGTVLDIVTGLPVRDAGVHYRSEYYDYPVQTGPDGKFVIPGFYPDSYTVSVGKWGYGSLCVTEELNSSSTADVFFISSGYDDDFSLDFNWTVSGSSPNRWARVLPAHTIYDGIYTPGKDVAGDCMNYCYVTDNDDSFWTGDVDSGITILASPVFNPVLFTDLWLKYSRWFCAGGGQGVEFDSMNVYLSNGKTRVLLESVTSPFGIKGAWVDKAIELKSIIEITPDMQFSVEIMDFGRDNLVEGAIDKWQVTGEPTHLESTLVEMVTYPNPSRTDFAILYNLPQTAGNCTLVITDMAGRLAWSTQIPPGMGRVEAGGELSAGIYLVTINGADVISKTLRIVKLD